METPNDKALDNRIKFFDAIAGWIRIGAIKSNIIWIQNLFWKNSHDIWFNVHSIKTSLILEIPKGIQN